MRLKTSRCAQEAGEGVPREVMPVGRTNRPVYSWAGALGGTRELGGLEEGVGSEDGGDDLAGGVDGAFAV